jgi:hypothetical protein
MRRQGSRALQWIVHATVGHAEQRHLWLRISSALAGALPGPRADRARE